MNSFDIRVQYSKGQIIKILNHFNHFKDIKLTTNKYHVCKGQVYRWRKDRNKYEIKVVDGNNKRMGKPGRRALFPNLEEELYNNIILHDRHVLDSFVDTWIIWWWFDPWQFQNYSDNVLPNYEPND